MPDRFARLRTAIDQVDEVVREARALWHGFGRGRRELEAWAELGLSLERFDGRRVGTGPLPPDQADEAAAFGWTLSDEIHAVESAFDALMQKCEELEAERDRARQLAVDLEADSVVSSSVPMAEGADAEQSGPAAVAGPVRVDGSDRDFEADLHEAGVEATCGHGALLLDASLEVFNLHRSIAILRAQVQDYRGRVHPAQFLHDVGCEVCETHRQRLALAVSVHKGVAELAREQLEDLARGVRSVHVAGHRETTGWPMERCQHRACVLAAKVLTGTAERLEEIR